MPWHALFVQGQSFSVKIFDRSRSGCQVIGLVREMIFMGLLGRHSLFPRVSPSFAHYFQVPATQARLTNSAEWMIYDWLNCPGTNQLTEWLMPIDWLNNWVSTFWVMYWITEILYDWLYCPGSEQLNWLNNFRLIELSRDWPTDQIICGWLID